MNRLDLAAMPGAEKASKRSLQTPFAALRAVIEALRDQTRWVAGQMFGIHVQLQMDNGENLLRLLARNEVHRLVIGRPPAATDCEAKCFATNPLAIVAAPNHPLARRKQLPFAALAGHKFVVREDGSGTRAAMERLFAQHKTPLLIEMEMPSNETIKHAVMAGMGLSFLSSSTLRRELVSGHIALVDVQGLPLEEKW